MASARSAASEIAGVKRRQETPRAHGVPLFRALVRNPLWDGFILLCIVANAIILGYDAHFGETNPWHQQIEAWNNYFLYIFTIELVFEFLAQGPRRYFRGGWNLFDMAVVAICYVAMNPAISALRTLRVVRIFRLISAVPQMRRVVEALFASLPGILAAFAILSIVFYIGAVMATTLFHNEPGFRDLGESALTLFALTQFDNWGETVTQLNQTYPYAWVFILTFTIVAAFAVLNLFVGVIVEAVQEAPQELIRGELEDVQEEVGGIADAQEDAAAVQRRILEEIAALRSEIAALRGAPPPNA